jgi:site-specific DNA-methyltransferase (adenine-specific)
MNNFISEVTNEDCIKGMIRYPDKYFDLAIIDPPYGIGEDGSKNHTRGKLALAKNYKSFAGNDISAPDINYFNELLRVSKNQIIWGANHFIKNIPYNSSCWIVWDKDNTGDFADAELAYTSFKSAVRIFKFRWNGMLQQNMKDKEQRIHPTQKPVALYKWLLQNYAKQGDKILDTHLGSGSSRIAAYEMGFDFTAFELDKEYFEAQEKRYKAHIAQLKLELK